MTLALKSFILIFATTEIIKLANYGDPIITQVSFSTTSYLKKPFDIF